MWCVYMCVRAYVRTYSMYMHAFKHMVYMCMMIIDLLCADVDEHEWIVAHCRKGINDGDPLNQWPRKP